LAHYILVDPIFWLLIICIFWGKINNEILPTQANPGWLAKIDFLTTYLCYQKFDCSKPPLPQAASLFHFIPLPVELPLFPKMRNHPRPVTTILVR